MYLSPTDLALMKQVDDIAEAKRVLTAAGYLCIRIKPDAAWAVDDLRELDAPGLAVECDTQEAYDQMMAVKRVYNPDI